MTNCGFWRHFLKMVLIIFVSDRSSCLEVFCKKDVLSNFAKSTGKHPCQSRFFNKVKLFLKRDSGTGVFLCAKFQSKAFSQNTSGRLLLKSDFLRILQNFSEHILCKTSANRCFCWKANTNISHNLNSNWCSRLSIFNFILVINIPL